MAVKIAPEGIGKDDGDSSSAGQARRSCLQTVNYVISGSIERAFRALGCAIARRPVLTVALSVLCAAGLSTGVLFLKNETRGERLWLPANSQAMKDGDYVTAEYPRGARFESVYLERVDGGNVLTPAVLDTALALHNRIITEVTWKNEEVPWQPAEVAFVDVCSRLGAGSNAVPQPTDCFMTSALALFGYNASRWRTQAELLAVLNDNSTWDPLFTSPGFVPATALGGLFTDDAGAVAGARVIALTYFLASNATYEDAQEVDPAAYGWEQAFLDDLQDVNGKNGLNVYPLASRSFDDVFSSTIQGDIVLLNVAIAAIATFTVIALSDCRNGCVGSRVVLGLAGLGSVGMAVAACYGFGGYAQFLFSPLMTILPFIMIGVGVDGMFVLQGCLDTLPLEDSIEECVGDTLSHSGTSVTVASLTNFAAFLIGANTSLPALRSFSLFAAMGLLFNLILQMTFFTAMMTLDRRRTRGRRLDILCCLRTKSPPNPGLLCGVFGAGKPEEKVSVMLMRGITRLLRMWPGKVAVLLVWASLLTVGIVGCSKMYVEADINSFIPMGSYVRDYLALSDEHFTATGVSAALYFRNTAEAPLDFSSPLVRQQMRDASTALQANEYVVADTWLSWLEAFEAVSVATGGVQQATFFDDVAAFLRSPVGRSFHRDVAFVDSAVPQQGIRTHRFRFEWRHVEGTMAEVAAMRSTRRVVRDIPAPTGAGAFTYSQSFLQLEQYASVGREAFTNILLSFTMIAAIIVILLANPLASLLTFICVASAILQLVGLMFFFGFRIDSVTVIFIVISLGLAVDYSVHVAHAFLACRETDVDVRVEQTLVETGSSVINGATSTLIAAFCLAGSQSYVFLTFCVALLTIVLAGAFQGLFVLPVLLSIFKPAANAAVKTPASAPGDARSGDGAV